MLITISLFVTSSFLNDYNTIHRLLGEILQSLHRSLHPPLKNPLSQRTIVKKGLRKNAVMNAPKLWMFRKKAGRWSLTQRFLEICNGSFIGSKSYSSPFFTEYSML